MIRVAVSVSWDLEARVCVTIGAPGVRSARAGHAVREAHAAPTRMVVRTASKCIGESGPGGASPPPLPLNAESEARMLLQVPIILCSCDPCSIAHECCVLSDPPYWHDATLDVLTACTRAALQELAVSASSRSSPPTALAAFDLGHRVNRTTSAGEFPKCYWVPGIGLEPLIALLTIAGSYQRAPLLCFALLCFHRISK